MRDGLAVSVRLVLLVPSILSAIAFSTPAGARAPIVQKSVTVEYEVQSGGLYTATVHSEIQATNSSEAAGIGEIPIPFSESMEDLDVVEAYTLKVGGKRLPVDTGAIFPQLQPGDPQVPLFSDMRQKVVVFPDVTAGDTVVWTVKRRSKQLYFPGQFMVAFTFSRVYYYKDAQVTIRAPKSLPLHVETHGLTFSRENAGDQVVYRWHLAGHGVPSIEPVVLSTGRHAPRLFVSSFKSYDELAHAYAALAADKIEVTPKIQALADEITAGLTDRRQQAQKLYEWVSKHIRYVAIFIGAASLIPHDADAILANGYGDCKDHTVLFASLLKAKGIASEIVLINLDSNYRLPEVPTLAALNHAISYLPEFRLYADTTAGVAPFGILPLAEYGKPVVHTGLADGALRTLPLLPQNVMSTTLRTVTRLLPDGRMTGTTITAATGPMSVRLRGLGLAIQSMGPERSAKRLLLSLDTDGRGTFEVMPVDDRSSIYSITGHFDLEPRPRIVSGDSFVPPTGLELLERPGDMLMGPLSMTDVGDAEETPCFSGRQTEELSLELPEHKHLVRLPKDLRIEDAGLRYNAHWSIAGRLLTVRREFSAAIDKPLCMGKTRLAAAAALRQIREDYRATIALADD